MLNRLDAMKINSYLFDANEEYYAIGLLRAKMDVIEAEVRLKEARD